MAGKEDLRALASFVYTHVQSNKDLKATTHSIGASLMNRASAVGDLGQAIQSFSPDQDKFKSAFTNQLKGNNEKTFKKIIQYSAGLLKKPVEKDSPTHFYSKSESPSVKEAAKIGLIKTHGTAEHNFYRQAAPETTKKSRVSKLS